MTPIVFIHGIKGAHLAQTYDDSFDVIWSGAQKAFETIWDLELNDSGEVDRDPRDLITVMRVEVVAYGEILGRLRSKLPDVPVYIFRYDWRLDNKATAARLGEFLDLLRKKTGSQQFRFVTHSMGGLVLSAFLNLDPGRNLQRVERAVTTVPPFWGAPEVMRRWVAEVVPLLVGSRSTSESFRTTGDNGRMFGTQQIQHVGAGRPRDSRRGRRRYDLAPARRPTTGRLR
jgi:pimeloyl-ACP methyl ester carboxylesterase